MESFVVNVSLPGQAPSRHELSAPRTLIGREAGDLVLRDPQCSSKHAELLWNGKALVYGDLHSTNGSYVDGKRIERVELMPGTTVQIGSSSIQYFGPSSSAGLAKTVVAAPVQPVQRAPVQPVQRAPQGSTLPPSRSPGSKALVFVAIGGVVLLLVAIAGLALFRGVRAFSSATTHGGSIFGGRAAGSSGGEMTVKAVWFRGTPGKQVEGGTSDINLRISKNTKDGASVGVIEEFSGGAGNQWRTATWLAAFNASHALGRSLIDNEYLVRAGGHIDGPSAGMLMTGTMMALLRGKAVRADTTMTGTVNPDGSAGPVSGIVQKMGGAKAAGIKRFGYPMGTRNHVDYSDMSLVDLNEVGAKLGLEAREIHDLYEAYEFLTDDKLERPNPLDEAALELDAESSGRLRAKLTAWKARLIGEVAQLKDLLRKNPTIARAMPGQLAQTEGFIRQAQTLEKSDLPAAALTYYVKAALLAALLRDKITFLDRFLRGDIQGIMAQVDEATALGGQVKAFGDGLAIRPKHRSVGGQVNATLMFSVYVGARNLAELGEEKKGLALKAIELMKAGKLKPSGDAFNFIGQNLMIPIAYFHCAKVMLDFARDFQDLVVEEGEDSSANLAQLGREAGAYGSAAGAALAYFDALITDPLQQAKGLTKAQAQSVLADKELSYLLAHRGVALTEVFKAAEGEDSKNLLRLAAGVSAYLQSAGLVNKYYALGAQQNEAGEITITARKSLIAQLEQARLHAREAAARAKATAGFVPIATRLDYQVGTAMREGSDADKLDALNSYWASAFWSDLADKLAAK